MDYIKKITLPIDHLLHCIKHESEDRHVWAFLVNVVNNFVTPPTDSSTVELCFADDAGEDLIWEVDTQNKKHCAYAPNILIPVSKGAKRILRYANPESVRVTTRFLWQT